ncbi:MAG: hypothetical protein JST19_18790 [Bacteroidetes bacterium]|nr:hypothetical protein [Bacteroidota bacterium]
MANWCHNGVRFTGDPEKVAEAVAFMSDMRVRQEQDNNYEMPDYIDAKNKGMVEIYTKDDEVHFRSAWEPPLKALCQIADHYGIGYINKFEEPGMFVYGKVYYHEGELHGVRLKHADLENVNYDEDRHVFIYEGHEFDDDFTIIYGIFEKQIADFEAAHPEMVPSKLKAQTNSIQPPEEEPEQQVKKGFKR